MRMSGVACNCCGCTIENELQKLERFDVLSGVWEQHTFPPGGGFGSAGFVAIRATGVGSLVTARSWGGDWYLEVVTRHEDIGGAVAVVLSDAAGLPGITVKLTNSPSASTTCGSLDILDSGGASLLPRVPPVRGRIAGEFGAGRLVMSKTGDRLIAAFLNGSPNGSASVAVDITGQTVGSHVTLSNVTGGVAYFWSFLWDRHGTASPAAGGGDECHEREPCKDQSTILLNHHVWEADPVNWAGPLLFGAPSGSYTPQCHEIVQLVANEFGTDAIVGVRPLSVVVTRWDRRHGYGAWLRAGGGGVPGTLSDGDVICAIFLDGGQHEARFSVVQGPQPYPSVGANASYVRIELYRGGTLLGQRDLFNSATDIDTAVWPDLYTASLQGDQFSGGIAYDLGGFTGGVSVSPMFAATTTDVHNGDYVEAETGPAFGLIAISVDRCGLFPGCPACEGVSTPPASPMQHAEFLSVTLPSVGACNGATFLCRFLGSENGNTIQLCYWQHASAAGHVVVTLAVDLPGSESRLSVAWKSCDDHVFVSALGPVVEDCDGFAALPVVLSTDPAKIGTVTSL